MFTAGGAVSTEANPSSGAVTTEANPCGRRRRSAYLTSRLRHGRHTRRPDGCQQVTPLRLESVGDGDGEERCWENAV